MFQTELRRLASERGLTTQQQIANACGLSQSFVGRLLSGESANVTAETLYALSRGLGVDCRHWEQFFGLPPAPKAKPKRKKK